MQDHEIVSATWSLPGDAAAAYEDGPVVPGDAWVLSSGEPVTPLVWAANLASPLGEALPPTLRFVNRTLRYQCRPPPA